MVQIPVKRRYRRKAVLARHFSDFATNQGLRSSRLLLWALRPRRSVLTTPDSSFSLASANVVIVGSHGLAGLSRKRAQMARALRWHVHTNPRPRQYRRKVRDTGPDRTSGAAFLPFAQLLLLFSTDLFSRVCDWSSDGERCWSNG